MSPIVAALWLSVAAQTPSNPAVHPATAYTGPARFRGALELSALSFPSGPRGGSQDLFLVGLPILAFDGGADFGLELGAALRLRVFDDPPSQRADDHGGILRREDWDTLSDFGQVLRELRVGGEADRFRFRAGALHGYSLGQGQLVSRYGNRLNPDYHPAGVTALGYIGPTRTELFASDILGGRIFGGALSLDLGRIFGGTPGSWDRWHASLELVRDLGRAGGAASPMSLAWVGLDGLLVRGRELRMSAHLGGGGRYLSEGPDFGATLGLSMDAQPGTTRMGGRLEARKQNGGFRQGIIGYDYELSRFSAVGLWQQPLADERLPDDWSMYGELSLAAGGGRALARGEPDVVFQLGVERYLWGRTNLDVALSGRGLDGKLLAGGRFAVTGMGQSPRYLMGLDARWRFYPSLYVVGEGGTVFFPQPEGGLSRGMFVGLGVGADFER
jgi:hypothetical protein